MIQLRVRLRVRDARWIQSYKFDFSSLCGTMDYTFTDRAQHTYYAHICGRTNHYCLPGEWALFLVALQRCTVAP